MKTLVSLDFAPGIVAHAYISFEGSAITSFHVTRVDLTIGAIEGNQRPTGAQGTFTLHALRKFATQLNDVCTQLEEQTSINSSELAGQRPASKTDEENASATLATPKKRVTKKTPTQSPHKPTPEHPADGARDGST